jgi:monoamine oxidase
MKKKVIVIGAGLSGVYLAYLLQERYEVTILEARERTGGRIFSHGSHDLGPSWIWSHQKNILKLLSELKLELFSQYTKGYALYDAKEKVEIFHPQPSAPSARVKASLTKLIEKLQEKLSQTKIILSQKVLSVRQNAEGLTLTTTTDIYEADYAIVTLPPRLCATLEYEPQLPLALKEKMLQTQTWMGNSMKCVIEFESAFWRERGLSGFMFSNQGPIGEMHDACSEDKAALFGFVHSNASMQTFQEDVKAQLMRVFGIKKEAILEIYFVDWRREKFTSSEQDAKPLSAHPSYGIETSSYEGRVFFSSTEFSFQEGGYLEGAIINAQRVAQELLNKE